jgi:hypothetical protein
VGFVRVDREFQPGCGHPKETIMDELTRTIAERGDLAHLALAAWAASSSALLVWSLRELIAANKRFNDFVHEIATLNQLFRNKD